MSDSDSDIESIYDENNSTWKNVPDQYDELKELLPKKDPIIKITLFKCNNGLQISDIELVSDDIIDNSKLRTIKNLEKNLKETPKKREQLEFISNDGKTHEKIMSIYLVLSNPVNIMLGEVINVTKPTNEKMLEEFYHTNRKTINNDLCTIKFKITDFVTLLDETEIFLYIVKLQIISKELVKNLFDELMIEKEKHIKLHPQDTNPVVDIPMNIGRVSEKINKIIEENEILKNTELKLLYKFINGLIMNEHTMNIHQLRDFYTNLKSRIGTYVGKILEKRDDTINIDKFGDNIYEQFRKKTNETMEPGVEMIENNIESALDVSVFESIKDDIVKKINNKEYDNQAYDPLKTSNPIKQHNDLVLLKMNENIKKAENELAIENANPIDKQLNKPFLVLKKNYLITLFVMTYIKMQYIIYDEYMKKNKKISKTMKIELLDKLFNKTHNKITAILKEALKISDKHKSEILKLIGMYAEFEESLSLLKVSVEELYDEYNPDNKKPVSKKGWFSNGGTSKNKKNKGKHTRKGNRKI